VEATKGRENSAVEQPEKIRILIVDDIPETRENLRKLLSFAPEMEVVGVAGTGEEGVQLAKETVPHVVLMDINLPGIDGITATEQIVRELPAAQIIILSVQGETGYMRRAMAAGARDFLVKPPSGDELMDTIRRVYEIARDQASRIAPQRPATAKGPQERKSVREAPLITVFAPKGGVGATTVTINLALALQNVLGADQRIALFDGNLQFGDVGVMLNLQASRSIADLATQIEEMDADMLTSVMTPHPSGVKALLAPPHPEAAEPLLVTESGREGGGRKVQTILRHMARMYDLVIADTWSWVDEITLALMDEATLILLVITPLVPSIKDTRHFLDLAGRLGYSMDKMALVVNYADYRTGINMGQIEKVLMPSIGQIPFEERAGIVAANRGAPLVIEEEGKPVAQSFLQLATSVLERLEELVEPEEEEREPSSAPVGRRVLGRASGG